MMTAGLDPPIGEKARHQLAKLPKESLLKTHHSYTDSSVKKLKFGTQKDSRKVNTSGYCDSGSDEEDNNNGQSAQEGITRRTRAGRMLRNRKYRRAFEENRQTKKLFTPEIKRFLKGWLVRRRKNPYPNRNEKKELAVKTGLTYIQICNWFANWRRKLKNSCTEDQKRTWGHLIKGYNTQAHGNVEQFSISSDDSIWDESTYKEDSPDSVKGNSLYYTTSAAFDHCYTSDTVHCTQSTNKSVAQGDVDNYNSPIFICNQKPLKRKLTVDAALTNEPDKHQKVVEPPVLLTKWLESAAKFRPRESYISWSAHNVTWQSPLAKRHTKPKPRQSSRIETTSISGRHREELDAAEALTYLSHSPAINFHRQCIPTISGH